MRKLLSVLFLLLFNLMCYAQTAAVSATVVDLDGTTWANGKWKIEFIPNPAQPNINVYNINGTPLSQSVMFQNGVMDGSGNLSVTIYQNQVISPAGSSWVITACPNAVTQCGSYKFTANSSTLNLSSILTPIIPVPRFHPISGAYGYNDAEAILSLQPGSTYWNVTGGSQRCYTGSAWGGCGTSGGGGITQLTQDVTAGPGTGSQVATVKGINGVPLCTGFLPATGQALTYTTTSTPNPCWGPAAPTAGVTAIIPGSGTDCTTKIGGQCSGVVTITSSGSGNAITVVPRLNPSAFYGSLQSYDPISSVTPWCDIRTQGAHIDGSTDIGPAVQACINTLNTLSGGTGTVFLPCIGASGAPGCYWANSSAITQGAGFVKFVIQGIIQLGSTLVGYGWENGWYGDGGGNILQFQYGISPATFYGPNVNGNLITGIPTANTATNLNIGFAHGSITNLPVGSAITIAGVRSDTATAVRLLSGQTTYTLTHNSLRIPPGELITVSNCLDTSFRVTNIVVSASDYTAQTVTVFQTSTTPATTTGCTVTGFNEDLFESARILCSNGVGGTFNGVLYNSCGAGQVTIMTKYIHTGTDQWGEVAAGPSFNTFGGQTWKDLTIFSGLGMGFWAEGSTNLTLIDFGVQAGSNITSGAAQLTGDYASSLQGVTFQSTTPAHLCPSGSCSQSSYPYPLLCDSDASVGNYYSHLIEACSGTIIEQTRGSWMLGGGIKLGDGVNQLAGVPSSINNLNVEEPWGNLITIDNRMGIQDGNQCLSVDSPFAQDNISNFEPSIIGYTDREVPSGCARESNVAQVQNTFLSNSYFNGRLSVDSIATGTSIRVPLNNTAPTASFNEGHILDTEVANEGESFSPQIIPYGSLSMTSYSVSAWNALCVTAGNCTVHAIVGPDGPSGQSVAGEIDTASTSADIVIGADTRAVYPGDKYIIWAWGRPGSGTNQNFLAGVVNGVITPTPIYISSGYTFAPTIPSLGSSTTSCSPVGFGSGLSNNGWSPQVGICTFITGSSGGSTTISFHLIASNGSTSYTWGNQIAEPGWTFIPGPNNPACTAAGTCNLTTDQIETARRDQYHGCVPPGLTVGAVTTCESLTGIPQQSSTTPTVNTASCIKAIGPPVVIGYCSTALSGTPPTCTCN